MSALDLYSSLPSLCRNIDELCSHALYFFQKYHDSITGKLKSCLRVLKKEDLVLLQLFAVDDNNSSKQSVR